MSKGVIVITGASNGIGESLAHHLTVEGFDIVNLDIANQKKDNPSKFIRCDVRSERMLATAQEEIEHMYGRSIYALVNNAGVSVLKWFEDLTGDDYTNVIDTNIGGVIFTTHQMLPLLRGGGTVLNIISSAAYKPMTNSALYNASKGAILILTRQMARELQPRHSITVFGVAPNKVVETEMSKYVDSVVPGLRGWTPEFAKQYELSGTPCKEYTDKETFTKFLTFLLKDKTNHKYLSGNILEYGV